MDSVSTSAFYIISVGCCSCSEPIRFRNRFYNFTWLSANELSMYVSAICRNILKLTKGDKSVKQTIQNHIFE